MRRVFVAVSLMMFAATAAYADPAPKMPEPFVESFELAISSGPGRLGIAAIKISPELRAHLGAPSDRGVLVDSVRAGGVADKAGVRVGDIVVEVDGKTVRSASEVIDAMADRKKGDTLRIEVIRKGVATKLSATLDRDPAPAFGRMNMRGFDRAFGWGDREIRRMLDEMRRRLDQLERNHDGKQPDKKLDGQRT